MARELAHPAGVDARGMAAGVVFLDQDRFHAPQRQMQGRRTAMDAATDDDDVGGTHYLSTALRSASLIGSEASSASVIGFTGGRSRK